MARTVTVDVKMKIADFEANGAKVLAELKAIGAEAGVNGTKVSAFSKTVTSSMKDGETAFQSLSRRSTELRNEISSLRTQFAKTGDIADFTNLRGAEKDLASVERFLKAMVPAAGTAGEEAGMSFVQSFGKSASALLPDFLTNPIGLGIAAGVAAVAVPLILLAFEGAVTAGVGLGLVGAAALIQRNNPLIQTAVKSLGSDVSDTFKEATKPLINPFVAAIGYADLLVNREGPELRTIFADLEPAIDPLVRGFGTLATDTLPSLDKLARAFVADMQDPAVKGAVKGVDDSFQGLLRTIAANPKTTSDGIQIIANTAHFGISVVNALADAANAADRAGHKALTTFEKLTGQHPAPATPAQGATSQLTPELSRPLNVSLAQWNSAQGAINGVGQALQFYATEAQDAIVATSALNSTNLDVAISTNDFNASVTTLIGTLKTNKGSLKEHTAAGEADRGAILDIISAQKSNIPLWEKSGLTVDQATAKYNTNLTSLEKQLAANGELTPAIQKLIDKYLAVPKDAKTDVGVNGLSKAKSDIATLKGDVESIPTSKTFTLHVVTDGNLNQATLVARVTGQRTASRWGGVYQHAADGLLSGAATYAAATPGRYMIAEPSTHGEAFIPRVGDYHRSMNILSAAAGWYGAHVVPGYSNGGSGGGAPVNVYLSASDPGGRALIGAIRLGVQSCGGDPIKVLTPK